MSTKHKDTIDRLVEEIKKVSYAMIEQDHLCESPIAMVKEAINYLDDHYRDSKKERTMNDTNEGKHSWLIQPPQMTQS